MTPWQLRLATRILEGGGVIAYPTEAVYGLGCRPDIEAAVRRILALKRRPAGRGLIVVASRVEQIEPWVDFSFVSRRAVLSTWPGPVTWILPAAPRAAPWLLGGDGLAVRVSAHPVVRALCDAAGPLVSTSANPAARPPARTALTARRYFAGALDWVVPGSVGDARRPSEIRDARTGAILRKGG